MKLDKISIVIAVIALLISLISYCFAVTIEEKECKQGPIGETGLIGPQGLQGEPGINGTDGINGSTGPQGPRGYSGSTGSKGAKGDKGDPGEDCECNEPPILLTNYTIKHYASSYWYFFVTVNILDKENDPKIIDFYYRFDIEMEWIHLSHQYGYNDTYRSVLNGICNGYARDIYWLVEVDDGKNIVWDTYEYRICAI